MRSWQESGRTEEVGTKEGSLGVALEEYVLSERHQMIGTRMRR